MDWHRVSRSALPGLWVLFLSPFLVVFQDAAATRSTCASAGGVRVCVEMRGPCDLSHLLPREKTRLQMELFHVSIRNTSGVHLGILPENFYGVTVRGQVIAMDPPFYQSIELRTKLRRKNLGPGEETKGFLFFPTASGAVRTIVHGGDPYLEIMLY